MDLKGQLIDSKCMISFEQLLQIFNNSYDGIIVTDSKGNVLFASPSASIYMGISLDMMIGQNVYDLVKRGIYDQSVISKAIEDKRQHTAIVNVFNGNRVMSTATPILDEKNEIVMTVTNVRVESLLDKYAEELRKEKTKTKIYRSAINYINSQNVNSGRVIADSPQMKKVLEYLTKVSKTNSTVLLLGESGTGKEVLSRFIHDTSRRAGEPFIPVNCAAIPKELMESEFFGYEKGAFSGALAKGKPGLFEMADHGILFLDEIAEMPFNTQSKFLRILETGEHQRLGGTSIIKTDVRIIAATNKDLEAMVRNGTFREDLFYRLNVIPVKIPPLRERKEDIVSLAQYFLNQFNRQYGSEKILSNNLVDKFKKYSWPGNIRELKNVIERLVISSSEDEFMLTDTGSYESTHSIKHDLETLKLGDLVQGHKKDLKSLTKAVEKEYIERILRECNWRISEAAKILGLHRSMLYRKMQDLNIEREK